MATNSSLDVFSRDVGKNVWNVATMKTRGERWKSLTNRTTERKEVSPSCPSSLLPASLLHILFRYLSTINGELCTWFDKMEFIFSLYRKIIHSCSLSSPQVCKPEAVGRGSAIRAVLTLQLKVSLLDLLFTYLYL